MAWQVLAAMAAKKLLASKAKGGGGGGGGMLGGLMGKGGKKAAPDPTANPVRDAYMRTAQQQESDRRASRAWNPGPYEQG
jgi:hypothetical protein